MEKFFNRRFKFNSCVLVVRGNIYGSFYIETCKVIGMREHKTAYSDLIYLLETSYGSKFEALPCNMYLSVEEIKEDLPFKVCQ